MEQCKDDPRETMLADHAEAWFRESGMDVPDRNTLEWDRMYTAWVEFVFGPER